MINIKTEIIKCSMLFLVTFFVTRGICFFANSQGANMLPTLSDIGKFSINRVDGSGDSGDIIVKNVNSSRTLIYDINIPDMSCKVIFMPHAIRREGIRSLPDQGR